MTDRLLTADEVAELLSVPLPWVRESTRQTFAQTFARPS
jgi:hypothetical protein